MPRVSGFDKLPPTERAWLCHQWEATGYGDNERLAALLGARLRERDPAAEAPAPSTVHRWGTDERDRRAAVRAAAEYRAAMLAALPDGASAVLPRVLADLDARIYEEIDARQISGALELDDLVKAHQSLTARQRAQTAAEQAALAQEKWHEEQAARADERARAAARVAEAGAARGLSSEDVDFWRRQVLGVAT